MLAQVERESGFSLAEIREMGRATQGVTLISVDNGTHLAGLQRLVEAVDGDDAVEKEDGA